MEELERLLSGSGGAEDLRIAIVGIGNPLNADDVAGVQVARGLIDALRQKRGAAPDASAEMEAGERALVIAGGPAPESFSGPLRRFQPEVVVLVDAAEMGEPPGTVGVFDWTEALGMSASTHTMPPSLLARFLAEELHCRMALVGIQPASLEFDGPVSPEVRQSVDLLISRLAQFL